MRAQVLASCLVLSSRLLKQPGWAILSALAAVSSDESCVQARPARSS